MFPSLPLHFGYVLFMYPKRLDLMEQGLTTYKNGSRSSKSEIGAGRKGQPGLRQSGFDLWFSPKIDALRVT